MDDEINIDDEIKALMDQVNSNENSIDSTISDASDFIGDISVYDTVEMEPKEMENKEVPTDVTTNNDLSETNINSSEKKKGLLDNVFLKLGNLNPKTAYTVIGILSFLIIALLVLGFYLLSKINVSETKVSDTYLVNNNNDVLISTDYNIFGNTVTLHKITLDSINTVFYFNNSFDTTNLNFTIIDENQKEYLLDTANFNYVTEQNEVMPLRFEPLQPGIRSFILRVYNDVLKENCDITIYIKEPLLLLPAKHMSQTDKIFLADNKVSIQVSSAVFSETISSIYYSVKWENQEVKSAFGDLDLNNFISLSEGSRSVLPLQNAKNNNSYVDANTLKGRVDFEPLRNIDSVINIKFNNLSEKKELNIVENMEELFYDKQENEKTIPVDKYNIILERFGRQGNKYLLVFHTEEAIIEDKSNEDENTNPRVETQIDATLIATIAEGVEITMNGKSFSTKLGTDVVFSVGEDAVAKLSSLPSNSFRVEIKSAKFMLDDINYKVHLINEKTIG